VLRGLATAARPFLESSPAGFTEVPLLSPRPSLEVGRPEEAELLAELAATYSSVPGVRTIGPNEVASMVPVLRPEYRAGAILEEGAGDIDVHALHQGFLAGARSRGGRVVTRSRMRGASRDGSGWTVQVGDEVVAAGVLVDAAGAWGDDVARRSGVEPLGLSVLQRTAFTVPGPGDHLRWPAVFEAADRWYFKPEGPDLLGSPADETPVPPQDAKHREIDVALGIERINEATTLGIRHVHNAWAGLRTFTSDRIPAAGPDPDQPGFVWLVGLGGWGIKASHPLARWVTGLIGGGGPPADLTEAGVRVDDLDPARFR
jgi:D-arginine dehydrogenase